MHIKYFMFIDINKMGLNNYFLFTLLSNYLNTNAVYTYFFHFLQRITVATEPAVKHSEYI